MMRAGAAFLLGEEHATDDAIMVILYLLRLRLRSDLVTYE